MQLNTAAILNGVILSSAGTKLSDASIRLEHSVSGKVLYGFSDAEGKFAVNGLPFGSWMATVSHAEYQDMEQQISINAASVAQEFRLTRAHRYVVSSSMPSKHHRRCCGDCCSVATIRTAVTSDTGEFSIAGIPFGQAELRVTTQVTRRCGRTLET